MLLAQSQCKAGKTAQAGTKGEETIKFFIPPPYPPNKNIDPNLYEKYIKLLLVESPEKIKLNDVLKSELKDKDSGWTVEALMGKFKDLNKYDCLSEEFELNKNRNFERFIHTNEPLFPDTYKQLGLSPRIQPTKSSCTINGAKKFL